MKIQFDETNMLSGVAGEANGISRSEIGQHQKRALDALASFRKQSEANEQGFPHLPFQTETIKEVRAYADSVRGSYDTVCLIGIGGSALGAWALDCGIRGPHPVQGAFSSAHPRLVILDNVRSEEHTSELQSLRHLVCRLLLDTASTEIYTLSLHDALPISLDCGIRGPHPVQGAFSSAHPRLVILDNVDPAFTSAALASMNPRKTLAV